MLKSIIFVLILLSPNYVAHGQKCDEDKWQCERSGECLELEDVCNGLTHCQDGSDETAKTCVQNICPSYSFRCSYGACVNGDAECNGRKDCADSSDEIKCRNSTAPNKGTCSEDEFQCNSGQCIPYEKACNGVPNCDDNSDETVDLCAVADCPHYAFRCGYGACVDGNAKCNKIKDCYDGSDESPGLCGTGHSTEGPLIPNTTIPTTLSGASNCLVKGYLNVVISEKASPYSKLHPGDYVGNFKQIQYSCAKGYKLEGISKNICINGSWISEESPACIKYCPQHVLQRATTKFQCRLNNFDVNCSSPIRPGTIVIVSCADHYEQPNVFIGSLKCTDDGEWDGIPSYCIPKCGTVAENLTPFITGSGHETNIAKVPWHVAIYRREETNNYNIICGGTIISANIVLSAAHCFKDSDRELNHSLYTVAVGKYYSDFNKLEKPRAQFFNLSEIYISEWYSGIANFYQGDIAILVLINPVLFSAYVRPICIRYGDKEMITSNVKGKVAGWGSIEPSGTVQSEQLRSIELSSISHDDCIKRISSNWRATISSDKFCLGNNRGDTVCKGDSGGGFVALGKDQRYYLWGIISSGIEAQQQCSNKATTTCTSIHRHNGIILQYVTNHRVV